ncbi:expressed unknown protein [Seminavis robusta]|uniref:Uncharacterized protein n=1 Tax=Seminavis robusta TaxID=568900 RepID=A0A9N8E1H6_9STRA|nr:expressed unknown protein [Seminavis robusta]|eukprot:Sro526_g160440.1 n/a (134) ;mRNA; f:39323-39724
MTKSSSPEQNKNKPTAKKAKSTVGENKKKPATAELRILSAIAKEHAVGIKFACKKQILKMSLVKEISYNTFLNILKRKGRVVATKDGGLQATQAGYEKLGPDFQANLPKTDQDVQHNMKQLLKCPKRASCLTS